ncbi:hypothetical protein [Cupriavidus sp. a3]|uniref:hypothetical protein n=1 Tax=Cupriavidus sp. a3 TaxID=3242158 RepID=UPI003D9C15EB
MDEAEHKRRYTRRALVTKVESAGFELVDVTSFSHGHLPAAAARQAAWRRHG